MGGARGRDVDVSGAPRAGQHRDGAVRAGERYTVAIGAADIGTGAWTVLAQIAADALEVDADRVEMRIGDTRDPKATVAGGSTGTSGWGSAIVAAALAFRKEHGDTPPPGLEATADAARNPAYKTFSLHSFGAQFAEVRVNRWTGEIRVPRMLGVFSAGRIVNPGWRGHSSSEA
ncbi:hypothetical protein GCM10025872_09150 [Barrientosiimonas endolithica]|uniref:Aldehyde oxidase/xanthine dehydrogenase second molybdopterin binding domain-containing protein n=1 Tax=Barrientosiimonas endolithica TaxID=1535208 RepID=A0ABM8H8N9_9MICO|nr:hypothetical protein GCM10025872_09150 [Barrientosiimonas endolithica]